MHFNNRHFQNPGIAKIVLTPPPVTNPPVLADWWIWIKGKLSNLEGLCSYTISNPPKNLGTGLTAPSPILAMQGFWQPLFFVPKIELAVAWMIKGIWGLSSYQHSGMLHAACTQCTSWRSRYGHPVYNTSMFGYKSWCYTRCVCLWISNAAVCLFSWLAQTRHRLGTYNQDWLLHSDSDLVVFTTWTSLVCPTQLRLTNKTNGLWGTFNIVLSSSIFQIRHHGLEQPVQPEHDRELFTIFWNCPWSRGIIMVIIIQIIANINIISISGL